MNVSAYKDFIFYMHGVCLIWFVRETSNAYLHYTYISYWTNHRKASLSHLVWAGAYMYIALRISMCISIHLCPHVCVCVLVCICNQSEGPQPRWHVEWSLYAHFHKLMSMSLISLVNMYCQCVPLQLPSSCHWETHKDKRSASCKWVSVCVRGCVCVCVCVRGCEYQYRCLCECMCVPKYAVYK